ncbi:N-acetylmuramic acid 6-phosphate etherase [Anaerococcus sp. Marseille-P3915]|uniref:N-acetylmuramic acid 6-phosphate etherase n=1 Tax=Anaerococcus sp. Marseille-P3915 TaxID=2057799 RepID=UPI000D0AEA18|nr:N-acetylmuramic acid 6-phosphate etherase [Anaerococcus sp. Marseille-P3915]
MMENFFESKTESRNTNSVNLDNMTSLEIVRLMNEEDKFIAYCIENSLTDIAKLIEEVAKAYKNSGRLIYIGAGTSGRLGVLDASECPPTFSVDCEKVLGLIAGGNSAMFKAVENSEDSELDVIEDLKEIDLNSNDILVGITASGRTPYVVAGIKYAKSIGVKTGSISCNTKARVSEIADYPIEVEVGPEVLTGSTRLKAGTATKMVLNMITTASMVLSGKVYKNYMVDLKASNNKLKLRAENIVIDVTGVSRKEAEDALKSFDWDVKLSIYSILTGKSFEQARLDLEKSDGFLRKALEEVDN